MSSVKLYRGHIFYDLNLSDYLTARIRKKAYKA